MISNSDLNQIVLGLIEVAPEDVIIKSLEGYQYTDTDIYIKNFLLKKSCQQLTSSETFQKILEIYNLSRSIEYASVHHGKDHLNHYLVHTDELIAQLQAQE
jgi:hypothetical protein